MRDAIATPLIASGWSWLRAIGYLVGLRATETFYGYTHPRVHRA